MKISSRLTGKLFAANIIDGYLNFLSENSYLDLKNMFPNAFGGLQPNKIRSSTDEKHQRIPMREGKINNQNSVGND